MDPCESSISQLSKPCIPCWMRGTRFSSHPEEESSLLLKRQGFRVESSEPCAFLEKLISVHCRGESSLKPTCSSSPPDTDLGAQPPLHLSLICLSLAIPQCLLLLF